MRKILLTSVLIMGFMVTNACKDSPTNVQSELLFTSNLGNELLLDGTWESGCAEDRGRFGSEIFRFTDNSLTIEIKFYSENTCTTLSGEMNVDIEFEVNGTINATLNGETVRANKISGIQRINGQEESFRQSIFVEELADGIQFYHARFEEDGGSTFEGYPTDIIPIPFMKVSK